MRMLVLMGLTASGKSTVGRLLAKSLSCTFIDIDEKITEKVSMSVRTFYQTYGKNSFQELEASILKDYLEMEISTEKTSVISCGGGVIENTTALSVLKEKPEVQIVFLDNKPKVLFNRVVKKSKKQHSFPAFLKVPISKDFSLQVKCARIRFLSICKKRMNLLKTIDCVKVKTKGLNEKKVFRLIRASICKNFLP